ncbi:hypothetical protein ACTPOK_00275 [Streptomyces inhibens]|uniref:hypothetical protein n=1 Tax=Streptomyces inhibens TaxID=2293571 RepID=UPI00402ABAE1
MNRLRTWPSTGDDGKPYLPPIATTSDARYALASTVDSGRNRFQRLNAAAAKSAGRGQLPVARRPRTRKGPALLQREPPSLHLG